jgi:YVTN family beta-propeller protein
MKRNIIADRLMIAATAAVLGISGIAHAQNPAAPKAGLTPNLVIHGPIDASNWGEVTSPSAYTRETSSTFADGEILAGPNKFNDGNYYHGVLPNGKFVKPAGVSIPVGMNPLGSTLTPDGKFLIVSNDDERDGNLNSLVNPGLIGGYSLTVVDTATNTVASQIATSGKYFIGLQATGSGPYTVYASGGGDNSIKLFSVDATGVISVGATPSIAIAPITPGNQGYVTNYTPSATLKASTSTPTGFSGNGAKITFPAGSALSPDGKFLYVACNGDNSVAVIDTTTNAVVQQVAVGFFPYSVSVSSDGTRVFVSDWGVTPYKFLPGYQYDTNGQLTSLTRISPDGSGNPPGTLDDMFFVPTTSQQSASVAVLSAPGGDATKLALQGYVDQGAHLDALYQVGDTHPSATAIVSHAGRSILYVTKSNSDTVGMIDLATNLALPDLDVSQISVTLGDGHKVHGAYPNAIAISPDNTRAYVALAGINAVAVLDTTAPAAPKQIGLIPTGWYPTSLAISADGKTLYIVNAKGVGEDINPRTVQQTPPVTGVESFSDSNYIFGTVQKVVLAQTRMDTFTTLQNTYVMHSEQANNAAVVPVGGGPSQKIKHVFFILQENKTFDSMLGNMKAFGKWASTSFNAADGSVSADPQYTPVSLNTQTLASKFGTALNYYSDSEESDAGHQFSASGTASDYTEKTLLVKSGRGLLVNKNFDPEDYPEGGYIFNNAARNGVDFKDFGALLRIIGTDTGTSVPTTINDPLSGNAGYPTSPSPLVNTGDVDTATQGVGQSYFLDEPLLQVLGGSNPNGEPRLDRNYPPYNFNISDQRRAKEFMKEFDRMVASNTLPRFVYIYLPNDHTGGTNAVNVPQPTAAEQVNDGDVALGMVVAHIVNSPVYYDAASSTGSALFLTYDDAQSTKDHIHQHRTPLIVVSPFAKRGGNATHYSTASIVKTEELLLGLPPNNMGDLLATDLRNMFQPTYNGVTLKPSEVTRSAKYVPSPEGRKVWALVAKLDTATPDADSARLGALARISMRADSVHADAVRRHRLNSPQYKAYQARLYKIATELVSGPARKDDDD